MRKLPLFLTIICDFALNYGSGETTSTEITPLPSKLLLGQNFPNPVSKYSNIEFTIPSAGNVKISLIDINGTHITNYLNSHFDKGKHTTKICVDSLSDGIYIYCLNYEGNKLFKKLSVKR